MLKKFLKLTLSLAGYIVMATSNCVAAPCEIKVSIIHPECNCGISITKSNPENGLFYVMFEDKWFNLPYNFCEYLKSISNMTASINEVQNNEIEKFCSQQKNLNEKWDRYQSGVTIHAKGICENLEKETKTSIDNLFRFLKTLSFK